MLTVPTALLQHRTRLGCHYDWLVGMPKPCGGDGSRLWTARLSQSSGHWRTCGVFVLEPIDPHRLAYLNYQGPVSAGRGTVTRVDQGIVGVRLWRRRRIIWAVRMNGFQGVVEARTVSERLWRAWIVQ